MWQRTNRSEVKEIEAHATRPHLYPRQSIDVIGVVTAECTILLREYNPPLALVD